nr:ABC transporter substrate-binding protein [Lysobacter sp. CAU 1642]
MLEYETPAEVARAFTTGAVDVIAVTSDFAITLLRDQPETRLFLVIDTSEGADAVLAREPVVDPESLRGKRIGVESGPLGAFMLSRFLTHFGLSPSDLEVQYVDLPSQVEAWAAGELDLLITFEPNRTRAMSLGAVEIFSSRDIPDEITDVFLATSGTLAKRRSALEHFAAGWFRAVGDLTRDTDAVHDFIAERQQLDAATTRDMLSSVRIPDLAENRRMLGDDHSAFVTGLRLHEETLRASGLARGAPVDLGVLIDPSIIKGL